MKTGRCFHKKGIRSEQCRHDADPAEGDCGKEDEHCHKHTGKDRTRHRPVMVPGMAKIFCGIDFPQVERQRAEQVRAIQCQKKPAGKRTPVERRCDERPDPKRKVRIPDLKLELRVLLLPAHSCLIGQVKDRVPDETGDPDKPHKERSRDPDREIDVHEEVEDAQKDTDHADDEGRTEKYRGFACGMCICCQGYHLCRVPAKSGE